MALLVLPARPLGDARNMLTTTGNRFPAAWVHALTLCVAHVSQLN
jgi:hypothetical protein